jgi:large subunit ribosomal protein L17
MRHKHLNRTSAHRKAMFRNMTSELIKHERIKTTKAKAKVIKPIVEKIIALGRRVSLSLLLCVYLIKRDREQVLEKRVRL